MESATLGSQTGLPFKVLFSTLILTAVACVVIYVADLKWSSIIILMQTPTNLSAISRFPSYLEHLPGANVLGPFQLHQWYRPTSDWTLRPLKANLTTDKIIFFRVDGENAVFNRGTDLFVGCPEHRCAATIDKQYFNQSAAVVFFATYIDNEKNPFMERHHPDQIYVFLMGESPNSAGVARSSWLNRQRYFNWTMSYRLDSDIKAHYTYKVPLERHPRNFASGKTKLVAWIVSHCGTTSHREDYAKELQKHIPVDIFGKCGAVWGQNVTCSEKLGNECLESLRDYKFYLAFENSLCRDYVTEKFTNALQYETVPVAMGDGNYNIYPPRSYIHVYDFPSPAALANYLLELDRNDTAYNEYMQWRYDPKLIQSHGRFAAVKNGFCDLCHKLHRKQYKTKSYYSMESWWNWKGHCRNGLWLIDPNVPFNNTIYHRNKSYLK